MRCKACDKNLSDYEATRKIVRGDGTVEYVDLCNRDFNASGLSLIANIVERNDLVHEEDIEEFEEEQEWDNPMS